MFKHSKPCPGSLLLLFSAPEKRRYLQPYQGDHNGEQPFQNRHKVRALLQGSRGSAPNLNGVPFLNINGIHPQHRPVCRHVLATPLSSPGPVRHHAHPQRVTLVIGQNRHSSNLAQRIHNHYAFLLRTVLPLCTLHSQLRVSGYLPLYAAGCHAQGKHPCEGSR